MSIFLSLAVANRRSIGLRTLSESEGTRTRAHLILCGTARVSNSLWHGSGERFGEGVKIMALHRRVTTDEQDAALNIIGDWDNDDPVKMYVLEVIRQKNRYWNMASDAHDLLERIRAWDHLDTASDGDYWKEEIDNLLDTA